MTRGGRQHIPRPAGWRVGGPAPWAHLSAAERRFTVADVVTAFAVHPPARRDHFAGDGARAAAVLVPVFEEEGEARLILTKRPDTLPTHQGQIAFPGGKLDPGVDRDLVDAALREAHEEIALDRDSVEIVAELDHIGTVVSAFLIAPFVGVLPARPIVAAHPREVTAVFDVALSELLDDATWREERWDMPWAHDASMTFFELADETVWGATARILTNLLAHLTDSR